LDAVRHDIADGRTLHQALAATGLFAPLAVQMVRVGEETGGLDALLERVAEIQEGELDTTVDTLTTLLEPVLMVVLGGLLGGLILAMYLPVFRMGEAITGGY
jgi:type IV pilus assembly protein PilC